MTQTTPPPPTYRIVLSNQRAKATLLDKNICGGAADGTFRYDLEIVTNNLDDHGFVIDNRITDDLIYTLWTDRLYVASCETLAGGLINFIQSDSNITTSLMRVIARVYNKTGYVEVIWEKGQAVPQTPRAATQAERKAERDSYQVRAARSC